jgi:hypothetical protein
MSRRLDQRNHRRQRLRQCRLRLQLHLQSPHLSLHPSHLKQVGELLNGFDRHHLD